MTYDRPPAFIPATPEYVLAVIRDAYRQQCQYDPETEPDVDLTFDTTIDEWSSACDLVAWRQLGQALNSEWKIDRPDAAWRTVLKPGYRRTLRDLCTFIAGGATRPTIEPAKILGKTCLPAGAFFAVRSLLRDAGADVDSVTPSTALDDYIRRHEYTFFGPISRLAPNSLPEVRLIMPPCNLVVSLFEAGSVAGFVLGLLAIQMGFFIFQSPLIVGGATILVIASLALSRLIARVSPRSSSIEFGNLRTFRDLARALADGPQSAGPHERTTDGAG